MSWPINSPRAATISCRPCSEGAVVQDQRHAYDVAVVGGGLVGLSSAWQLLRAQPQRRVVVLEKEADVAVHQSDRNSGVVHAGVYYAPGSLKADYCRRGREALRLFCEQRGLAYRRCGKLIVAANETERERLHTDHSHVPHAWNRKAGVVRVVTQ